MLSSTMTFRTRKGRIIPAIIVAMLLASCSSQTQQTPTEISQDQATASSDYYLQQAQQSEDDNKAGWQLLAIRALLREGKVPEAAVQLSNLPQRMNNIQRQEQQLVTVEVLNAQKNYPASRAILDQIMQDSLSVAQKVRFYQAQIDASQGQSSLTLVRAYIAQEPLLSNQAHQDNIDRTWTALTQLPDQDVTSIVINADENVLQGWIDLLSIWQANRQDPDLLKAAIQDWQRRYPVNPAATTLPTQLNNVLNFKPSSTEIIALFLPISGQAQVFGNAIQQGFNAAMQGLPTKPVAQPATAESNAESSDADTSIEDPNAVVSPSAPDGTLDQDTTSEQSPVPAVAATVASNAQVKVYDTNNQSLSALLTQAQQDGATIVVGPLLKDKVTELSSITTPLNILALNQPEIEKNSPNICYFALSPEDEARDAARHMWSQHKQLPLLLVPRGSFGDRIAQAFADEWQKLGGQTVLKQGIGNYGELKSSARNGIRITGTPILVNNPSTVAPQQSVNINAVEQIDQSDMATTGNIDSLYVIATQDELAFIKPMIDMSINNRSKLAIYASSRSYRAGAGADYRLEMEGVQFSDIPLLAGQNPELMQKAANQFRNDYSLVRLYAMGIDAWNLANSFSQMRQLPGFQISGMTGELTANTQCVIHRKLPWLQYRQGTLIPVAP